MRKRLLLPLAFILCASAQAQPVGQTGLGIKGGAQWSTLMGSDLSYSGVPGGLVGLYFPILASNRLEFQPEVLLSYQGAEVQKKEQAPQQLRMLYAHLPLGVKVFLSNELNLQGGLQVGKCLAATMDDSHVTDEFRPFDVGFIAGLGLDLRSGFDLTARYYGGTTPVLVETSGVNPRNRLLQLTAGYRLMRFGHRKHRLHKA